MARVWGWVSLPCNQPCPPISATCDQIEAVLKSWLGGNVPMYRTLYCLPAQSSGTWLAAAVLPSGHALLVGVECDIRVEKGLAQLPKKERIKKSVLEYRKYAPVITTQWQQVKQICTQAERFEQTVLVATV